MKIAILGNYPTFPFYEKLGVKYEGRKISTWLINLSKYLVSYENVELHIIAEDEFLLEDKHFVSDNINFHFLKCPPRLRAATLFIGDVIRINKLLNKIKPDIVNAHHTDEYALAALKSDFPNVITIHGIYSNFVPPKILSRAKLVSKIEKYIIKNAKYLIASSPYVYNVLRRQTPAKFYDVENCIDEKYFLVEKKYSINYNLVYIGIIIKDKGIHYLLEAINILKKEFPLIRLNIVGNPSPYEKSYFSKLEEYIKNNNLVNNIIFSGFITEVEKIKLLSSSTLLVHPSRLETFCMSVAEAMATGTPVTVSNVGGLPFTVGLKDDSILFEYGNVNQMVSKIKDLLLKQEFRERIGKELKKEALNRFHPSIAIPELIKCFENIVNNAKNK